MYNTCFGKPMPSSVVEVRYNFKISITIGRESYELLQLKMARVCRNMSCKLKVVVLVFGIVNLLLFRPFGKIIHKSGFIKEPEMTSVMRQLLSVTNKEECQFRHLSDIKRSQ